MKKEKRDVLIVVDMLKGFHNMGNLANPRTASIIPPIQDLLKRAAEERWLTIFLADSHKEDDEEFKMFPKHCVEGTEEAEIIDELKEFSLLPNSVVIPKTRYSGFYGTNLDKLLRKSKPKAVIVVGVCIDICVLHTVADLRNRGYHVVVPEDCVETFDAPWHVASEEAHWAFGHMEKILGARVVVFSWELF